MRAIREYVCAVTTSASRSLPSWRPSPRLVDGVVAALLFAEILSEGLSANSVDNLAVAVAAALVLCGAMATRRMWPLGAVVAGVLAGIGQDSLGGSLSPTPIGVLPAALAVFYGAGAFLPERRSRLALAVGVAGVWADDLITSAAFSEYLFDGVMLVLLPWATGRMLRERRVREETYRRSAERLDAQKEQRARTAALGERTRIARELHDVIAHSVSVMVIQAGGARTIMDTDPGRAGASLLLVERAGREALAEMRRLLGVLDGGADPHALAPQPGIADVADLVSRACGAGLATTLDVQGPSTSLPPALDLCAFRIVQEALTNAMKHAGPAHASVRVRWTEQRLELAVDDDGRGQANGHLPEGGHGIAGMTERAALHGGSVNAGRRSEGGFSVRATLPIAGGSGG